MTTKIGYLGPQGTFTEEAARHYNPLATLEPLSSIYKVALAVTKSETDEGVVPIENSLEGSVTDTLDILIRQDNLFIRSELVLPIEHCLLISDNLSESNIQVIYSHPQALGQCRQFLEDRFPNAHLVASLSTAAAVIDMRESKSPAAAIATHRAAQLNDANVLIQSIQDNPSNVTRFVVLSKSDHPPTGADKTSLCFSFAEDKPGLLHSVLSQFAHHDINLAKVESRPTKQSLGEYIFLIDVHGHRKDPPVMQAIQFLQEASSMLKVFGSYPRWDQPAQSR